MTGVQTCALPISAVREYFQPPAFFEALGCRYMGPVDGHDIPELEEALRNCVEFDGPVVLHVLTQKGRGYLPAEDDDEKHLHDAPVFDPAVGPPKAVPTGYTQAFAESIIKEAEGNPRLVTLTAAMPGPTGLLPFQARFPDRFFDVGIAEQHAVTAAAGMAMGGLRPVVAIYSTFLSRAWDQVVYDVALHRLPVVFCLDRAGITGDDGPSHHGLYDMVLLSKVPGMTVFAPSSAQELQQMLHDALELCTDGPAAIRYPKGAARQVPEHEVGHGMHARRLREGDGSICVVAVGKMIGAAEKAVDRLAAEGIDATLWDPRVVHPFDPVLVADAARHAVVVCIEDGLRDGGVGMMLAAGITEACQRGTPVPRCELLGVPTRFIPHGKPDRILAQLGLDADGLTRSIRDAVRS